MAEQDFYTAMETQVNHIETKARLTQAEKLLRSARTVLLHQKKVIEQKNKLLAEAARSITEVVAIAADKSDKLNNIPLWVRRIFDAD